MVVGGLAVGPIADRVAFFHRRMRLLLVAIMLLSLACAIWASLALPVFGEWPQLLDYVYLRDSRCAGFPHTKLAGWGGQSLPGVVHTGHAPLLPAGVSSSGTSIALVGLFLGATSPLYYELGVELTFPAPELVSSGFISLVSTSSVVRRGACPWLPRLTRCMRLCLAAWRGWNPGEQHLGPHLPVRVPVHQRPVCERPHVRRDRGGGGAHQHDPGLLLAPRQRGSHARRPRVEGRWCRRQEL